MKRTFFTIAAALLTLGASAQEAAIRPIPTTTDALPTGKTVAKSSPFRDISGDQQWFGLYNSDALAEKGTGYPQYPGSNKAAIDLNEEMLQAHIGSKVVGIRFGLCQSIGESRVFIVAADRYGNGDDIVSQRVATTEAGWNTVMLDHPVAITAQHDVEWLVGFDYEQYNYRENGEYASDCFPLSCVAEGVSDQPLLIYYNRPDMGLNPGWYEFYTGGSNLSVQLLIQGSYNQNDVSVDDLGSIPFEVGDEILVPVQFTNNCTEAVSSLDYVVTIDGTAGSEQHVDFDPTVAPSRRGSFSVTLPLSHEAGTHEVSVEVTKVNGNDNESEHKTGKGTINVYADKYPRNLVIEEFTTELCPNCPRVADLLHDYLETANLDRVFAVCHHSGYHNDWLTQDCDEGLLYLFNDDGTTYAPGLMFNRQPDFNALYASGNIDNVLFPNTYNDIESYANYQLSLLSNARLDMQVAVNADTTLATVTINGECNDGLDQGQNLLTLYLTEDNIAARDQYGATGTFTHQHVIRYYNSTWGDPIAWNNKRFTTSYSIAIDKSWKKDDLRLVAFLNKHNAEDKLDNRIENSIGMSLLNAITPVEGVKASANAVETARYNAAGQRILGQQKGLNIIRLSDGRTQKVVVR